MVILAKYLVLHKRIVNTENPEPSIVPSINATVSGSSWKLSESKIVWNIYVYGLSFWITSTRLILTSTEKAVTHTVNDCIVSNAIKS